MTLTTLRRRKANAYRIETPVATLGEWSDAAEQAAWDAAGERVVYQRSWGQWTYLPGEGGAGDEIVDHGRRRDEIAAGQLPFTGPMDGALVGRYYQTPDGDPWAPEFSAQAAVAGERRQVEAMAVSPGTGNVAVYWHRGTDQFDYPDQELYVSVISPAGSVLSTHTVELGSTFAFWPTPIACAWDGDGTLWAAEPMPAGTPGRASDNRIPMRIVKRVGGQGISAWREIEGWSGVDSICPDPDGSAGLWAFITRRWDQGTGPYPDYTGANIYDTTYVLPLSITLTGTESLLDMGFTPPGPATAPWTLDTVYAFGRAVCLDSLVGGDPTFVSIGTDPAEWPDGAPEGNIWRFHLASGGTRTSGAARASASYAGGAYARSVWRAASSSYLVHPGRSASVPNLVLESLP